MSTAGTWPRIYALAPGHLGGETRAAELSRIAGLGFDGVWLTGARPPGADLLGAIAAAGLAPILDLAIARLPDRKSVV